MTSPLFNTGRARVSLALAICMLICTSAYSIEKDVVADGPYIFYGDDGSVRICSVDALGNVRDTMYAAGLPDGFVLHVSDGGAVSFDLELSEKRRPDWDHRPARRTLVLSDPHGRLDLFVELLKKEKVIDKELRWRYGRGHLVVLGDVFDRGEGVTQILWLLYKLEDEAARAGGRVSYMLGNHETMVLAGDLRYVCPKYLDVASSFGMTVPQLYGPDTELGRWLSTRNTVERIGDYLLVHAGLGPQMLVSELPSGRGELIVADGQDVLGVPAERDGLVMDSAVVEMSGTGSSVISGKSPVMDSAVVEMSGAGSLRSEREMDTGDNRFLMSKDEVEIAGIPVPIINEVISEGLFMDKHGRQADSLMKLLYSSDGPLWYRGLVRDDGKYHPATDRQLDTILRLYGVRHIIVGHTIFDTITILREGRVIAIDVETEPRRAILISKGVVHL